MPLPITLFIVSSALVWVLIRPLRVVLVRLGMLDVPNRRSSHVASTVRGGGAAITIVIIAAFLAIGVWKDERILFLTISILVIAGVSFWDDWRPISASSRLFAQILCAAWALGCLLVMADLVHRYPLPVLSGALLIAGVTIVGYTNAFNFMDGIDGLAGSQALVTGLGTAIIAHGAGMAWSSPPVLLALVTAGAAAGFLPHNLRRGWVFMGDVGSASLGFLLAVIAIWITATVGPRPLVWLGLLHLNFILDAGVTLVRRLARGDRWSDAHREHFYQRLIRAGHSHRKTTCLEMTLQAVTVTLIAIGQRHNGILSLAACVAVILIWTGFMIYAELEFRHFNRSS